MDEIRGLLARGVPETARPFGGLVYRQALEHLHGVQKRSRHTRADRTREPALRAAPVDLVPQRA